MGPVQSHQVLRSRLGSEPIPYPKDPLFVAPLWCSVVGSCFSRRNLWLESNVLRALRPPSLRDTGRAPSSVPCTRFKADNSKLTTLIVIWSCAVGENQDPTLLHHEPGLLHVLQL